MEPDASGSNFENYKQPEDTVISVSPAVPITIERRWLLWEF